MGNEFIRGRIGLSLAEKISDHILGNCVTVGLWRLVAESQKLTLAAAENFLREKIYHNIRRRVDDDYWLYAFNDIKGLKPSEMDRAYDVVAGEYENGYIAGFMDCVKLLNFSAFMRGEKNDSTEKK